MASAAGTFVELLRGHAAARPDDRALTFLALSSRGADTHLSYAELDRRARAIASVLQTRLAPGDRAVLLFQPGLDYVTAFFGCLYAGVVAVPAYPPQGHRQLPRLEAIVADATPRLALTTSETLRRGGSAFEALGQEAALAFLTIDTIPDAAADAWRPVTPSPDALAFLQYTSGSTGTPKGAMMRHGNLMHNSAAIHRAFGHGPDSMSLLWVPPYHDMGLIGGILQPLYGGFPGVLMSPLAFFKHPLGWLQAVSRLGATTSGGPNFAYELCARRVRPEDLDTLDLSRWALAFNGAEPVRAETMRRFAEVFAPCGFSPDVFYPCYGLAESTLLVTGGRTRITDATETVTSGSAASAMTVRVVDPETLAPMPPGEVGEVWVAGPSVAAGYWDRPDATTATFDARIAGSAEGPFLRTGDLGFLADGGLIVTGRLKDLIILSGRNHYPQDLEWTVERAAPTLRAGSGAAFTVPAADRPEAEALVLTQEWEGPLPDAAELTRVIAAIRRDVASDHALEPAEVLLVAAGGVPKTSSGKVRRSACRAAYLAGELPVVAAWREAADD